jgi:hypothetical protein
MPQAIQMAPLIENRFEAMPRKKYCKRNVNRRSVVRYIAIFEASSYFKDIIQKI